MRSAGYGQQLFLTGLTLNAVPSAIANAGVFYITHGYGIWKDFCDPVVDPFIADYQKLNCAFLLERRKSFERCYVECNRANRLARANVGTSGSETSSNLTCV